MRTILTLLVLIAASQSGRASAADLPSASSYPRGSSGGVSYGELWSGRAVVAGPARPVRRLMGDSNYVGSVYGLGKPAYSGVGPRPDWGRSSYD